MDATGWILLLIVAACVLYFPSTDWLYSWILPLIVAACVVALIVIAKKRKELEDDMSYGTDFDSGSTTNKPVEEEKVEDQAPPQVTIYEYRTAKKKRLCSLCDGENDSFATHCHVCGQELS